MFTADDVPKRAANSCFRSFRRKPHLPLLKHQPVRPAQRTQVEDVRALVGMLVQTERFGTSIA